MMGPLEISLEFAIDQKGQLRISRRVQCSRDKIDVKLLNESALRYHLKGKKRVRVRVRGIFALCFLEAGTGSFKTDNKSLGSSTQVNTAINFCPSSSPTSLS